MRTRAAARLLAVFAIVALPLVVVGPWLMSWKTYGFHDWDVQTSHRYLMRLSLREYGQFPGWNPFACGGFPAWGYVESGTALVSPLLPLYLFVDMAVAIRIEVLAMTLLGALGCYVLAGRFTRSHAARAFVVVVFAVNGRWGLQAAAGHTWHLAYALTPWCLWSFERARATSRRTRDLAVAAGCFAALVYTGGIYPLPHTALLVGLWAVAVAVVERSPRPLVTLALVAALAVGLAAPKLLPMLSVFAKAPRVIESAETLSPGALLTLLTSRDQTFGSRPAQVAPYGWHEWGMYVGAPALVGLVAGVAFARGKRAGWLKAIGLLFVALGFGAFHPLAPWTLLHAHAPLFSSQHVPSRFLYPASLVLGLVAAISLDQWLRRRTTLSPWLEPLAAAIIVAIGVDVALIAQKPMKNAMWMEMPDQLPHGTAFSQVDNPVYQYKRRDWAGPMYLAMIANQGVLNCYGTPPFEKGALSRKDKRWRGEAYVDPPGDEATPAAKAEVTRWTPNEVELRVTGAGSGAHVVYNMNHDVGFTARVAPVGAAAIAGPAESDAGRLAARVPEGDSVVTFTYAPPRMTLGLVLAALTIAAMGGAGLARRRRARATS